MFYLDTELMKNQRKLIVQQLDQQLSTYKKGADVPPIGWIRTIRKSLNMTLGQLANKLKMSAQGVKGIEEREANGSITLNSLKETALALDLRLVYGFVPKDESLDQFIDKKALELARKIVLRTHQTMILEDQQMNESNLEQHVYLLAAELKGEMSKALWD